MLGVEGILALRVELVNLGLEPPVRLGILKQIKEHVRENTRGRIRARDDSEHSFADDVAQRTRLLLSTVFVVLDVHDQACVEHNR